MGRTVRGFALACHLGPTLAVTAVTTAVAAGAGRSAPGCVAVAAAVLAGQLSVGWLNDGLDAARDRTTGRTDKPVVRGEVSERALLRAAPVALLTCAGLSLLSGWRAAVAHLIAVGCAWAYDLGLKATVVSVLTYAVAFALLPVFVTLGLAGHPWPRWWAPAAGALLGAGAHLANALPDLEGDRITGVRGLPQRLGFARSARGAGVLLVAASGLLGVAPSGSAAGLALPAVSAVAVITGLRLERGGRGGAAFAGVIVAAAVDVAVLVARGTTLVG
ncbi:MAG TPA: UbiA family prenyltransferase [Mycobacteriales bacterium]|nr:UbiA family prenyltransferase [Mycobacteriales bacterium]